MTQPLRVIVVDSDRGRAAILEQALTDAGHQVVDRLDGCAALLSRARAIQPDIILVDVACPDRDVLDSLSVLHRDQPHPVVMFAQHSDADTTAKAIRAGVSAYVVDGLTPHRLQPILEVAIARFREFQALRRELDEAKTKLSERKIIERAKGLLMERKGLNEDAAYQKLRKLAMDRGQKLVEVANSVIAVLELLDD